MEQFLLVRFLKKKKCPTVEMAYLNLSDKEAIESDRGGNTHSRGTQKQLEPSRSNRYCLSLLVYLATPWLAALVI